MQRNAVLVVLAKRLPSTVVLPVYVLHFATENVATEHVVLVKKPHQSLGLKGVIGYF